jgi:hypothetical protein
MRYSLPRGTFPSRPTRATPASNRVQDAVDERRALSHETTPWSNPILALVEERAALVTAWPASSLDHLMSRSRRSPSTAFGELRVRPGGVRSAAAFGGKPIGAAIGTRTCEPSSVVMGVWG